MRTTPPPSPRPPLSLVMLFGACVALTADTARAEVAAAPASPQAPPEECGQRVQQRPEDVKKDATLADLQVVGVTRADTHDKAERARAGLYNTLCVQVNNLAGWMTKNDPGNLVLYVDTYVLRGIHARPVGVGSNFLHFDLERTDDEATQKAWRSILSRPKLIFPEGRVLPITIGHDDPARIDDIPMPLNTVEFKLVDVNRTGFFVFFVCFSVALGLFFWLAAVSDLLRDDGPEPVGVGKRGRPNRRPFSLGRTQMAFWFFIVIACYVFIWMVTSDGNTITNTVLGLIGMSAATALGAVAITNSKSAQTEQRHQDLADERNRLTDQIARLDAIKPRTAIEQRELTGRRDRLKDVEQLLAGASRGFFRDILSDAGGISFHRFQIVAWTVALGFIFLSEVFSFLMMPEFSASLLGLMGISSGTYLGFKFPEKQA